MPDRIAHYNILERVGTGGMGEVYRGRDTRLGRTVAIKVLPESVVGDPDRRARFLQDARAAATLSHPSIATLFDVGEEPDRLYLVFEYVRGQSLAAEIGGKPMGVRGAVELAIQLADAVADAHAVGVFHRDLKPANIVVTPKGRAKILDFGLAAWTRGGASRAAAVTRPPADPGVVAGTLAYMSPEQLSGDVVDERSDIFSLGTVIYEMLTGRNPFTRSGDGLAAAAAIFSDGVAPPSGQNPAIPEELDRILQRALAKQPKDRYETAATLAAELRVVAAILDVRSGDREPVSVVPRRARRPIPWRWLLLALATGAIILALWLWRDRLVAAVACGGEGDIGPGSHGLAIDRPDGSDDLSGGIQRSALRVATGRYSLPIR